MPDEPTPIRQALFEVVEDVEVDGHRYVRVSPRSPDTLAEDLAPRITAPYFDQDAAVERILRAARELDFFAQDELAADDPRVLEAAREERDAVLPAAWRGDRPQQLDVQRSELGEIVASDVLSSLFGTRIPASRIAHKETPDQQTRGADVMGWEDDSPGLVLVLSEVKGSTQAKSPPSVIAGMEAKLRTLLTDRRALHQELIWLRDHASEEHSKECASACVSFQLRLQAFSISLVPVLLRPSSVAAETDPGVFRDNPTSFAPAPIRFVTIVVEQDLFDLASDVFARARSAA